MQVRLSEHETNDIVFKLEERKYGRRFTSMELAQKANVPLDDVNRVERQLPIENPRSVQRIARALGITPDLLPKVAGQQEISQQDFYQLMACLEPAGGQPPQACEQVGLR